MQAGAVLGAAGQVDVAARAGSEQLHRGQRAEVDPRGGQRGDVEGAAGPAEHGRVENRAGLVAGEADVGAGPGARCGEGAAAHQGRSLPVRGPGAGGVDRLTEPLEVVAHAQQDRALFGRDRAVRHRRDVEDHVAVLAHPVDQRVQHGVERVVADPHGVAPAGAGDAVVGQPVRVLDVGRAAALEVEDLAPVVEAVLVGGDDFPVPRHGLVVVVRQEVQPLGFVHSGQVEVLPQDVGLVAVDDLLELVVPELVLRGRPELPVELLQRGGGLRGHVVVEAGEVVRVVHRHQQLHALGPDRVGVQPYEVQPGSLRDGVPLVDAAVPHREPVVVLGDRARELRTGVGEQLRPLDGVEVAARRPELRGELDVVAGLVPRSLDEVVVRPGSRLTEHALVVGVRRGPVDVHVARVPLVVVGRDAEDTPVEVDAELRVLEPLRRRRVLVDRGPGR